MPFNGSGVFQRVYSWVTDADNGLNVDATRTDTDTDDIASGLSNCITKDGQQTVIANIPMAGFKFTGLGSGSASGDSTTFSQLVGYAAHVCEFRLTLTSGTPVTTSDVSASATLYFSPYKGNKIALYDGSNWLIRTSAEMSIAVPGSAALKVYDVFCYDNSGVPTLELLVWTNDTTRATALATQDGVYVKSGAPTRRYVGTIRSASDSKCYDTTSIRHVWNYYNRVRRPCMVTDATGSWNYTTPTARQADANVANQIDMVIGVVEDPIVMGTYAEVSNSGTAAVIESGFGYDSTSAFYATGFGQSITRYLTTAAAHYIATSSGRFYPTVGRHYVAWLEYSSNSGTTTWYGGTTSGLQGEIIG